MRCRAVAVLLSAAAALLCCACAGARSACGGSEAALEQLIRRNYSEDREGSWHCADHRPRHRNTSLSFQFDAPGLPLLSCLAEEAAADANDSRQREPADLADGDLYAVMLSGASDSPWRYKCKACVRRWVATDWDPRLQRPLHQCGRLGAAKLELGSRHPTEPGARFDGVRCYTATRKGCDAGHTWCHGSCCRTEALFYYPQLQQPFGTGKLLTAQTAGPDEATLLKQLTATVQKAC